MPETTTAPPTMLTLAEQNATTQRHAARQFEAGRGVGLVPSTIEQATTLAQLLCKAEMLPKSYREKPADVLVAILFGSDLGLAPMQALQSIATINGRPSIYGDGFLAVILAHPHFKEHDEYYLVDGKRVEPDQLTAEHLKQDTTAAVCSFERHGRRHPVTRKFSVAQAKTAHLWTKDGPWKEYPDRMLMFRARGFAGRDAFPDALRGLLSAEEARDLPALEGQVVESIAMPVRQSEAVAAAVVESVSAPAPVSSPAAPATPTPAAADAPDLTDLPDGCDRIQTVEPQPFADRPKLWTAVTARGLSIYGYQPKVDMPALHSMQVAVRLVLGERPWKHYTEVVGVEVVG